MCVCVSTFLGSIVSYEVVPLKSSSWILELAFRMYKLILGSFVNHLKCVNRVNCSNPIRIIPFIWFSHGTLDNSQGYFRYTDPFY